MFSCVSSATIVGIDGVLVSVEVDVSGGLPGMDIVGMADTSVREARHRVRSALRNAGFDLPSRKITVNLSPAFLHKDGTQMDVGIAVGILAASGQVPQSVRLSEYVFLGELALDGSIAPVRGVLPMVLSAIRSGKKGAVVPAKNQHEIAFLQEADIRLAGHLADLASFLAGREELQRPSYPSSDHDDASYRGAVDFADIFGHDSAKRAIEVACAGGHNVLLVGPPGTGKSMLARSMPGIMPALDPDESLMVTRIYSVAGILPEGSGLIKTRPFRAPHHSITLSALIGGGPSPRPGEVTLAHRGVLFLDEFPEFAPSLINALRQPVEDGVVVVSRSRGTHTFPSRFLLVCAMNPCPCGYYGNDFRQCSCPDHHRRQYVARVNGPIVDRMDIFVEVQGVDVSDLDNRLPAEPSSAVKVRVEAARDRQRNRLAGTGLTTNAEMGPRELSSILNLSGAARKFLLDAYKRMRLSARAYYRVIKVACSIADLAECPRIEEEHVAEALSYRQALFQDR